MLYKNTASQKIHIYAYDSTTGAAKTGDAGNITAYVSLDGTANAIDDMNPAEVDATNMPGVYAFDLTQAETNCNSFALYAKSSTSNIRIEPIIGFTAHSDVDAAMLEVATKQGYRDGIDVIVPYAATPALRGTALLAAYATAKARTPYGAAISATNQVNVYLPPWWYDVGSSTLTLDTSYVNLLALYPEIGGHRTDEDCDRYYGNTELKYFRPSRTVVYSSTANTTAVVQSAQTITCRGFSVAQLHGGASGSYHAYYVSADDNDGSMYDQMYFWHRAVTTTRFPIGFAKHVKGTWTHCIANSFAWRIGMDENDESVFSAKMYDCEYGTFSVVGDYLAGRKGTHKVTKCRLERCRALGLRDPDMDSYTPGFGTVSGCDTFANDIDDSCVFIEVEMGDNSGGIGAKNEGLWIRCRGGEYCQGSTRPAIGGVTYPGEFAGIDIGGVWGKGSLGGNALSVTVPGKLTGTCLGSTVTGSELPHRVEGATVEDCLFTMGTNNQDCVTLLDSNSKITNSTLLVVEGGSGIPINASSALSVCAVGNTYNNIGATGQVNGLGTNVTNVGSPSTVALTAAYDAAKTAASSTELSAVQTHGDSTWATATGFSTHSASDVVTALGTGSTLTACATATGFAEPGDEMTLTTAYDAAKTAASATALSAAVTKIDTIDGIVDAIRVDTGTTLPASIDAIEGGSGGATAEEIWALAGAIDGKTPAQAMQIIAAAAAGKVSGAGSGEEIFMGLDGDTTRVTVKVDDDGNRSEVTYG